jgi:hypothetical protein
MPFTINSVTVVGADQQTCDCSTVDATIGVQDGFNDDACVYDITFVGGNVGCSLGGTATTAAGAVLVDGDVTITGDITK